MSKLLFDTQPLVIIPELAELIGLNESVILQQIHYWTEINRKANRNSHDGHHWTFNSYENWQLQFPFWSLNTIKRTFASLEAKGLLITGQFNKMKIDRTKWYRIDYEALQTLMESPSTQNGSMDEPKLGRPLPETNQRDFAQEHELGILTAMSNLMAPKRRWRN